MSAQVFSQPKQTVQFRPSKIAALIPPVVVVAGDIAASPKVTEFVVTRAGVPFKQARIAALVGVQIVIPPAPPPPSFTGGNGQPVGAKEPRKFARRYENKWETERRLAAERRKRDEEAILALMLDE